MPIDLQSKIEKMRRWQGKARPQRKPLRRRVNKSVPPIVRISSFLADADLTQAEREQAWRIVQSRRYREVESEQGEMEVEAVDVVVADRRVGELLCHGGEIEVL